MFKLNNFLLKSLTESELVGYGQKWVYLKSSHLAAEQAFLKKTPSLSGAVENTLF